MSCARFADWLDAGRPAADAAACRAHAAACPRCAAALAADDALEAALLAGPAPAPGGFADEVMRRVAATREARAHAAPVEAPLLPWWARAAASPPVVLACVAAGLAFGWREALLAAAMRAVTGAMAAAGGAGVGAPAAGGGVVALGYAMALAPLLAWGSWRLFRLGERMVEPGARAARPRG